MRVALTPRAEEDLLEIWLHVAKDNPSAADRLIDEIMHRCQLLTEHPSAGVARPDIAPDARMPTTGNYLILYRITAAGVEVARIVHRARLLHNLV